MPVLLDYRTADLDPEEHPLFTDIYGHDRGALLDAAAKWSGASTGPGMGSLGRAHDAPGPLASQRTTKVFDRRGLGRRQAVWRDFAMGCA